MTRGLYWSYTVLWVSDFLRLLSMGYYNWYGITAIMLIYIMFDLLKMQLFALLATFPLALSLRT